MSQIAQAITNYLEMDDHVSSPDKKFYISDMGKCERVRFLKRKGLKSTFESHVNWILRIGNLYHDFAYKALEAQGILVENEQKVETEHFRGYYDGIVKDDEGLAVLDIKSAGAWMMGKVLQGQVDEGNIAQVLTYLMLVLEEKKFDPKKAVLLYMNKEPGARQTATFVEKHFYLTGKRKEGIKAEMDRMAEYWVGNNLPKCNCPAWMKNYNGYIGFCEGDDDKVMKLLEKLEKGKIERIVSTKTEIRVFEKDDEEGKVVSLSKVVKK